MAARWLEPVYAPFKRITLYGMIGFDGDIQQ